MSPVPTPPYPQIVSLPSLKPSENSVVPGKPSRKLSPLAAILRVRRGLDWGADTQFSEGFLEGFPTALTLPAGPSAHVYCVGELGSSLSATPTCGPDSSLTQSGTHLLSGWEAGGGIHAHFLQTERLPRVCGDPCAGQVGGRVWRRSRHTVDYLAPEWVTMEPWYLLRLGPRLPQDAGSI